MSKLLLHICCGPCATYPATELSKIYDVVGYFYNPNIWSYIEWIRRYEAFQKFCKESDAISDYFSKEPLSEEEYKAEHRIYLDSIKSYEEEPEGGKRCPLCFTMRLDKTADVAHKGGIKIFATTLTIGRNKNSDIINPIGQISADRYGINFYEANWKKQDGARKGCEIAKEYNLYRQHYCGCEFSIRNS